jgi:hypothetical protein
MELHEAIAKVHEAMEGRYELDGFDLHHIHGLLCEQQVKNCNTPDVSVCTCALESTDVYDDEGNYLGYVCLGCGYFSKY